MSKVNRTIDFHNDENTKKTIYDAIKTLDKNQPNKITKSWVDNISNIGFDTFIMELFELNNITKYTLDYSELKSASKQFMYEAIKKLEKEKQVRSNPWFKHITTMQALGFEIIKSQKPISTLEINEVFFRHKEHFIIAYVNGGFNDGVFTSRLFLNASNKEHNHVFDNDWFFHFYQIGTNIFVAKIDFLNDLENTFNKIISNFNICNHWVNSNIKDYVPEWFFSDFTFHELPDELIHKMAYYNLPLNSNDVPTFKLSSHFFDKFLNAFNYLSEDDKYMLHIRIVLLNIKQDCNRFIKKEVLAHFENYNVFEEERIYLTSAIIMEMDKNNLDVNPFDDIQRAIDLLDENDCQEFIELVKSHKNRKYSRYKIDPESESYLKDKIRPTKIDITL